MANDITIIYITANKLRNHFAEWCREVLLSAAGGIPIVSVSKKPIDFGNERLVFDGPASQVNEYIETYEGIKLARTRYVAIAEDDTLYCKDHFKLRPKDGQVGFNVNCWGIFTWVEPATYNLKFNRHNHNTVVCERDVYIRTMEERMAKYPDLSKVDTTFWAEPGRFEKQLGITEIKIDQVQSNPPIIRFSHEDDCIGWVQMGKTKRMGFCRAYDIPYWGRAEDLLKRYHEG